MKRRTVLIALAMLAFEAMQPALAQREVRTARIGFLGVGGDQTSSFQSVREGLRELGYVEARNLQIEDRSRVDNYSGLPQAAEELVRLKVDVMVVFGATAVATAGKVTSTIPIVMVSAIDPVASGLAASLGRPGKNVTGVSTLAFDLAAKRLELLREILPGLVRVAALYNPNSSGELGSFRNLESAAKSLNLQLFAIEIRTAQDIDAALDRASKQASAFAVLPSTLLYAHRRLVTEAAAKLKLAAIAPRSEWTDGGLLISYGINFADAFRRAAVYVDKILKGTAAGDLPIEQATKFELVINLKTAKALGITVPLSILIRADRVIE